MMIRTRGSGCGAAGGSAAVAAPRPPRTRDTGVAAAPVAIAVRATRVGIVVLAGARSVIWSVLIDERPLVLGRVARRFPFAARLDDADPYAVHPGRGVRAVPRDLRPEVTHLGPDERDVLGQRPRLVLQPR